MSRWIIGCLFITLATAVPISAGTLYVPQVEEVTIEGIDYKTQLWVSNEGLEPRRYTTYFLAEDTDGTDREPGAFDQNLGVPANATVFISSAVEQGQSGMLEIFGAPQIAVTARLVSVVNGVTSMGARLPVISSENLNPAGTLVELVPLAKRDTQLTDLSLVNLGFESTQCNINLFKASGEPLSSTAVVSLKPLSMRRFQDVLGILGVDALAAGRTAVSCDQDFFAFATTIDTATGEIVVETPAALGTSALTRPGDEPPQLPCPAAAECFTVDGAFFTPTRGNDKLRVEIPVSKNAEFSQLVMELDFLHGGWFSQNPQGIHNIVWLTRNGRYSGNTVGFVTTRGPGRDFVRNEINVDLPSGEDFRVTQPVVLRPGTEYHLVYIYNGTTGQVVVEITEKSNGRHVVSLFDNVARRIRTGNGTWSANFSDNFVEAHVPSRGWTYSNFSIQFIP